MPVSMTGKSEQVEVITSVQRRRRWAAEEKVAIVQETYAPGMSVSLVARRYGIAPNLALIDHLVDSGQNEISQQAMRKALAFSKYLETHARRLYGATNEPERAAARAILTKIRKGELHDGFTAREVHQPIVNRCRRDSTCSWSCTISRHQALQCRNEEGVPRLPIRSTQGAGITASSDLNPQNSQTWYRFCNRLADRPLAG
jgi:transposase-like protein